ncbi:hypothetical protein FC820_07205 [Clostridium sporogenes]|uniref:hypothetical protein n=1 Tax=Clostridium sporogenes TaxID=1509 RepID=UPI0013D50E33|nr:hypothetical protein [Clostridium sporogenes]NFE80020.1 hypothetical protein [Clostridium sporogenes]NFG68122.1 hypothetical protein [Clostridium sporogenes]
MDDGIRILINNNTIIDMKPLDEQKNYILPDEDVDLNVYRILLLIYVLRNNDNEIIFFGRHKLILYDFLVKYPENIIKIAELKNKISLLNKHNINFNSKIYWPLEKIKEYIFAATEYDIYFNYLILKELIQISFRKRTKSGDNEFCIILTEKGISIAKEIYSLEIEWIKIIELINEIFGRKFTEKGVIKFLNEKLIGEDERYDY